MKRTRIDIDAVADWHNLAEAFRKAAQGCGEGPAVRHFRANLDQELAALGRELRAGEVEVGRMAHFRIRDPKPRDIHAPVFRERVLHHALIAQIGPVLDRALIDDTYACRKGKGTLAAVLRAQHHLRRWPWFAQIDIRSYFASIDHRRLLALLERKFKGEEVLALIFRILDAHHATPGKGLPIGALTSQWFANFYLAGLDRLIQEHPRVGGMVRYMDDILWCGADRDAVRAVLAEVDAFLSTELELERKPAHRIGRSAQGTLFCGHRILPGTILLTRRKRRRYTERRRYWEQAWLHGAIDGHALQRAYASVVGMTLHADATAWRREQLRRVPLEGRLNDL